MLVVWLSTDLYELVLQHPNLQFMKSHKKKKLVEPIEVVVGKISYEECETALSQSHLDL